MGKRLYIGNLSYSTSEQELRREFEKCGTVMDAKIISDRESGRSRGFGFIEFSTDQEAEQAIQELNGLSLMGRSIVVKVAEDKRPGGGGGGRPFNGGQRFNAPPPPMEPPPELNRGGGKRHGGGKRRRDRGDDTDWG